MLNRRALLLLASGLTIVATPAFAQSWKDKYPELVVALVPAENATGTLERYTPFVNYLSKELGVKVTLRVASDYTAVIEGQKNKQIHIGFQKGMLKKADGSLMTKDDFRIAWKSPLLPGSPFAYLADLPEDLKKAITKAFVDAPQKDKDAFAKLSDGKDLGFVEVTAKDYQESVKMNLWLDGQRKKKAS